MSATSDHENDDARTPQPAQRLRALFDAAFERSEDERDAWIDATITEPELRAALRALIASDARMGAIDQSALERAAKIGEPVRADSHVPIGKRFGAYTLTTLLGQGGMSAVYLGERIDGSVVQRAAVKVLKRGLYSAFERRLFEREQQVLASLSHPNIAYLIDGGITAAGVPYLILEYIDGVPLDRYVEERSLGIRARLELIVAICRAVAAAHRQLIVHRDLKPSNILVTGDGTVKLLDFGIAKLLDDEPEAATRTGFGALTPEYAAPEQLRGAPITTSTDVYALGVLLHELLTGTRPRTEGDTVRRPSSLISELQRDGDLTSLTRRITPTQLRQTLRGDLDNILLKALSADADARYPNAAELADDVQRHLDAKPVTAHPPSRWYRTQKFVARHRGGVLLAALAAVGVIGGLVLSTWQANIARAEATRADLVRDFVLSVFESAKARLPRDQRPTPEALVERAQAELAAMPDLDRATRIDLLQTLGSVWLSLAKFDAAETVLGEAEALAREAGDGDVIREIVIARAGGWQASGRSPEARAALESVLPELERTDSPQLPVVLRILSPAIHMSGDVERALALSRQAVAVAEAHSGGVETIDTLAARFALGSLLGIQEQYVEAAAILDPAIARWREIAAPEDDRFLRALKAQAAIANALGTASDAVATARELLRLHERLYTPPHPAIASSMLDLVAYLTQVQQFEEAEALLDRAAAMNAAVLAPDHLDQIKTLERRGYLYAAQRRYDDAEAAYTAALVVCSRANLNLELCARILNNRGQNFYRSRKLQEAERDMRAALAQRITLVGPDHVTVAVSKSTLANVLAEAGQPQEAVALQSEVLRAFEAQGLANGSDYALVQHSLAIALHMAGDHRAALAVLDEALARWRQKEPNGDAREVSMLVLKVRILDALGESNAARDVVATAVALNVDPKLLSGGDRQTLRTKTGRADLFPK